MKFGEVYKDKRSGDLVMVIGGDVADPTLRTKFPDLRIIFSLWSKHPTKNSTGIAFLGLPNQYWERIE